MQKGERERKRESKQEQIHSEFEWRRNHCNWGEQAERANHTHQSMSPLKKREHN